MGMVHGCVGHGARRVRSVCSSVRMSLAALSLLAAATAAAQPPQVTAPAAQVLAQLDFSTAGAWQVSASDDVHAALRAVRSPAGATALCLDYRFPAGVAGYVSMQRPWPLQFPAHYALRLGVQGQGASNALQVKFADASGWNVWWAQRPAFTPSAQWQTLHFAQREIGFAWGPRKDHRLKRAASVQLTLAAVHGGAGHVCFDRLQVLREPAPPAQWPLPQLRASSALPGHDAAQALSLRTGRDWRSGPDAEQTLTLDLGVPRPLGGLQWRWTMPAASVAQVQVQASDDGRDWHTLRTLWLQHGTQALLGFPHAIRTRWLRVQLAGDAHGYALSRLQLHAPGWGEPVAMLQRLAALSPRGDFPRALSGQQNDWTVLGVDGGTQSGLISADGRIEPFKAGWSVEPFVIGAHGRLDWSRVRITQHLVQGDLPLPEVVWHADGLQLRITAFGSGTPRQAQLLARYTLRNDGERPRALTLALAVRPFQVNPPQQFLNTPGGFGPITQLRYANGVLAVNGMQRVVTLGAPAGVVAGDLARQPLGAWLASAPKAQVDVQQAEGLAQGALLYPMTVPARGEVSVGIAIPWTGATPSPVRDAAQAAALLAQTQQAVAAAWRERLAHTRILLPPAQHVLQQTLVAAQWQMLLDRDGAALQPGTRSYARSWVRDAAMMSEALLRTGHADVVRDWLLAYAPRQFSTGKVPCCVDFKGADPTPENDSQGELIFAIAAYTRYTHDRELARQLWPHVAAAVRYMNELRATQKSAAYRSGERRLYWGLMPRSISHEGYSAKPMHSYWDDFWSLRGYRDAAWLAGQLGHDRQQQAITRDGDDFQRDFFASIAAAARWHRIDYIPGSADLGDFDPTSTTIALSPGGFQHLLPQRLLRGTFERYWRNFELRASGQKPWRDYTPYEWRNVDAFVRLGWRTRIPALLDFFFAGQRPAPWRQWAEVVWRDAAAPHFIGDMPHGWVASDFLRSALDLLAYERHRDHALVLAAGVQPSWLDGEGIRVENLRTPWGALSYHYWRHADGSVELDIPAGSAVPPGGLLLTWPGVRAPGPTTLDGRAVSWHAGALRISRVPARVRVAAPANVTGT